MSVFAVVTFWALATAPNLGPEMKKLSSLLDQRNAAEAKAKDDTEKKVEVGKVDAKIRKTFEQPLAVLISDMSGFTERTKTGGIEAFMASIRLMQTIAEPLIAKHKAQWVKADADDLFIVHKDPVVLLQLADDWQEAVAAHNKAKSDDLGLSLGLDFGPVLKIGNEDIFGSPVNVASKLGEDTAERGEILVSENLAAALKERSPERAAKCTPIDAAVRHTKFSYFKCR